MISREAFARWLKLNGASEKPPSPVRTGIPARCLRPVRRVVERAEPALSVALDTHHVHHREAIKSKRRRSM